MDNKTYHAFVSTEGNQTSYYFTDASTVELANQEAVKAAVKHFNVEEPTIQKLEETFVGLPEKVKAPYEWFIGVDNMFAKPQVSLEEGVAAGNNPDVEQIKSERKPTKKAPPKQTAHSGKKAAKKK